MEKIINEQILTGKFIGWELATNAAIVWLLLLALFFGIITALLNFHWKHYGITENTLRRLKKIYFRTSLTLIIIILTLAIIYFYL